MLILAMILQAGNPAAASDIAFETYRTLTAAEQHCTPAADATDITVCGLRRADRYRVPFVVHDAGDPLWEPVALERQRYLARTDNCTEKSIYLVGCGSFGLSVTTGNGRDGVEIRPMAK